MCRRPPMVTYSTRLGTNRNNYPFMSHQSLNAHVIPNEPPDALLELHAASPTFQGWEEEANYREPLLNAHRGNPLIEALPPILDEREAARRLRNPIPYDLSERELPSHLRLQQLRVCTQFFVPLGRHIELEQRISATLRVGYLGRNPRTPGYLARMHILAEAAARSLPVPPIVDYQATGEGGGEASSASVAAAKTRSLERGAPTHPASHPARGIPGVIPSLTDNWSG